MVRPDRRRSDEFDIAPIQKILRHFCFRANDDDVGIANGLFGNFASRRQGHFTELAKCFSDEGIIFIYNNTHIFLLTTYYFISN